MAHRLPSVVLLLLLFESAAGANILFLFGGGNYSHKLSIWPLVMALTDKGHNVTFVSSCPKQPKPNPKVIDLAPQFMTKVSDGLFKVDRISDRKEGKDRTFSIYYDSVLELCDSMMNSQEDVAFTNILENGKFDLVVINIALGECAYYIAHHLGSKFIMFDPSVIFNWMFGMFGLPLETAWIPDLSSHVHYPMTFWDRLKVHYYAYFHYSYPQAFEEEVRDIYKKRFRLEQKQVPTFNEIHRNASLVLVNSHYSVDFARALPPLFIDVGGMQLWEPPGVLPNKFKTFIDSYEDGVILISFGSTIEFNTLPEKYLSKFFNMMTKFAKIGFIWRWDGPLHPNNPRNLLSECWLPQKEIMREKSLKAFISHGGINSMQEATYNGVPVILMPLFSDQDFHAYRVEAHEIGVRIEVATLSQEDIDGAVWKILNDPKYKRNMMMRSKLFRDRPNPVQTAMDAVEFVLRHDDLSALKPMDLDQSFWVRQHVDIYLFIFVILAAINILIPLTMIWICRKCCF